MQHSICLIAFVNKFKNKGLVHRVATILSQSSHTVGRATDDTSVYFSCSDSDSILLLEAYSILIADGIGTVLTI